MHQKYRGPDEKGEMWGEGGGYGTWTHLAGVTGEKELETDLE